MAGSFRGASTHRSVRDTLPRRFHAACVAFCILLSGFANAASSNSGSSSASVTTATTTTTTTTTSITAAAIITDTRGPPGRRHNYWWWLALGVSGILILFLLLLLFLSWCCCARHQRRRSRAHGSDRQQQRREQQREPQGHDKRPSDGSGGTFSVSPDNFTTRNGSHETDDGRQPDEAAVAISNYVNTTANHPKSTLNQFGYDDVDAAGHDHHRSGDGSSPVKTRIFLAGGWRSSKPTKSKSTSSRSSSKSRKHASSKTTSPPLAAATATSPARGTDAPVAVWTNKPRTSATTNRTNPTATAPPPPLSALARSTSPSIEHLPPVDAASGEADLRTPNPLCPPPVPSSAAQALPETTETPPMVVIGAAGVAAGTPLMRSPAEQAMVPPVRVQQQQQPASPSPERVVDVPLVPAAKTNNAARNTAEQQLQLAKSPMRSSVKPRNITTSHRSPTREITQGSSKQYFFGYDRKPTAQNQHNGHNRGSGSSPSDGGSSDRGVVEADRQPSPVPPPQPPHQRQFPTSSPPPQQQQQQQQPQTSTLQLRQSPTPPSDGARLTPLPQRATPPQPQPQPSTSPAQPMPLSSSNAAAASAGPPPRPASASSPFTSQQFSPLRLAGLETEAPANTAVAAVVAAGPLVVSSDRPPRHEHASPHPRIPQQQQQQGQQRDVTASSRPPLTPTALHATSNTTTAGPASGGHYTSSGSVKKRIELFRKDSTKKHSPSPPHGRGRSGSAPAAVHGGRPPIPTTATTTQAVPLTSVTTNSAAARNTPSTVTKGVPQLFFGKRDTSPSRAAASKPRAASAHQRPPRPSSGQPRGYPTHINGFPGRTGSGSDLRLSAAQLSQPSAAALLPSHGNTSSASAAAALLGGGGSGPHHPTGTGTPIHSGNATQLNSATPANRFGSSRQTSPSHYGSVTSSMNGGGGNSPSRTSLSRVRSTSRVKFLDEDGVSVSTTGEREVRPTAEGSASAHPATTSPTAAPTQATTSTTTATAVAAGGTGAGGVAAGSTMSREGHGGAPLTSPKLSTTVPSASQRGSGSVLKGRPLAAGLARGGHGGLSAQRETLPDLPPAPATAQVLIEQGRRTAAPMSMPHGAATDSLGAPPQRTTSPARQRPASNRAASPETATPPFSTRTEAPLQMPLRTGVPAVLTPPTPALTPAPMQPPPTQRQTSPNNGSGRHNNNGQHNTAAGSGPVSPPLRAQAARTRRDISPVRPANDELASMSSDASTIPAGMLADPKARDRHAATAAAANAVQQQQQQQQQLQQQRTQSPSQQPPFSTVSPYSSARHILPRGGATVNTSQSPHPSGISVLRITQASGDVQLMPPPTSSQHNRSGAAFGNMRGAAEEEDEDVHVVNSYSRFASGNLASAGVSGGGSTQVRESGAGLPLHRPNIPADTTPSSGAHYSSSTRRNVSPHYSSSSRSNGAARSAGGGGGNRAGLGGGSATNRFGSATSAHRRAN